MSKSFYSLAIINIRTNISVLLDYDLNTNIFIINGRVLIPKNISQQNKPKNFAILELKKNGQLHKAYLLCRTKNVFGVFCHLQYLPFPITSPPPLSRFSDVTAPGTWLSLSCPWVYAIMKKLQMSRTVCRFVFQETGKSKVRTSSDSPEDCLLFITATPENKKFQGCLHSENLSFMNY